MAADVNERRKKIDVAQKGASALAESTAEAKKEKDALEKKKMQIEGTMAKLKEFTASQIESMNLYGR